MGLLEEEMVRMLQGLRDEGSDLENRPTMFSEVREENLTDSEREGVEHLLEMMLVAKQQIVLRKALRP